MMDGIVVVFEVGLALLRMHQPTLLKIDDPVDLSHWLNRQIATIIDPKILWSHVSYVFRTSECLFSGLDEATR